MRALYRILSLLGDAKAAGRGPGALGRRILRKRAHRSFGRALRRLLKP